MGTISTYLEPLGSELSSLTAKAHDASELGLSHVDSIIARLERARSQLINFHSSSIAPTDDDATMASESSSSLSVEDDLLPLSMLLKSSAGAASAAHKEWSSAVSKFAKSVDKVGSAGLLAVRNVL
ncbi:BQ2448_4513 [Microbotryum intermedium]|uniref:BQ2448_4513 protein n=1 Tax=Microbotryum intermedium TaxID=269621 RepID=A0A238FG97_9BASI|nr:BQ2448_4513 [Microbotryum intermedium]